MKPIAQSFRAQLHLYIFVSVLFLVGVVFGSLLVNALTLEQQQDIGSHVNQFVSTMGQESASPNLAGVGGETFLSSTMFYVKWVALIALLGISIIGFPLVLALVFAKGVFIGFSVGTLISQYAWRGVLFALVSVAPHNIVAIPFLMIASVASMVFAMHILKNRLFVPRMQSLREPLHRFMTLQTVSLVGMAGVAAIATWVSPIMMSWVVPMLS
ncbi:stage II sporulation protein M [Paenibacillus alvei]|uniref:Stage II sporulation protein M n=1 Tax=Paenibacillus alvei TaxID=44250 RepID=A0AAP6ZTW7_PAEAL|nr:stage II sporulation protein M [Paenibacillus alvei]MBG9736107.1 stage II sporulation protein M [Paenibacillus alvei]MBG9743407.1 stage II sporulation protein M [Paenibacillus alvei]MCY9579314.1 stage II sporulation protein M [Paenibacillus alvei]MCY9585964.1 stage II sporulation protein M [Paenibacillus alvei]NOJ69110.1 stage II sporulation protein M [Paenibacillus alvei]